MAEDNLPDALMVRQAIAMENLPLEVYIVADGQEAVEFIAKADADPHAPCPHFVLLDLNLPKKDGFEVLQRLRASEKCKATPVIVVTSSNSPEDQAKAAEMGAKYFRKPPSYDEFLKLGAVVRQIMEEANRA